MEELLQSLSITQNRLTVSIDVLSRRINEIVHGARRITANTVLHLERFFGTNVQFWVSLQPHYDLEVELDILGGGLTKIQPLHNT